MKNKYIFLIVMLIILISACTNTQQTTPPDETDDIQNEVVLPYEGKKVLFIDSYHEGYAWSDGILEGIQTGLEETGVELNVYRMDTKRNTEESFKVQAALDAKAKIEELNPDVVIACDDNAFNFLIKEHYKDAQMPFVYCGLNWDSSVYNAPYSNTAGMVEVSPALQLIEKLKDYSSGETVGFLSGDTVTENKVLEYEESLLGLTYDKQYLVLTFDEWKEKFLLLQDEVDMIVLENNAGITDWDDTAAAAFVLENTKVPAGSTYDWMNNYVLVGLLKSSQEQGEYSAEAALKILDGTSPADIPEVKNKKGSLVVNLKIADKLGVTLKPDLLKNAEVIE